MSRNVTDDFKTFIKTYGKQIDAIITLEDGTTIGKEEINKVMPNFNTSLFKTIMFGLEIDSNIKIEEGTKIDVKIGVKFGSSDYEYIEFNDFIVYSTENQEDTESYRIIAYDKMLESMIDFDIEVNEEVTIREYLVLIYERLGWDTLLIPEVFINSTKIVPAGIHTDIGYTFRDVLDEICKVTGSFIYVKNGIPALLYLNDINEEIDEEYLSEDDVTVGKKYIINALVFSRAEESDNIYRRNDESIEENGLYEFRISDNQILSTNDRVDYIDELFEYLKTIEIYIYDIKSTGMMWLEPADIFTLKIRDNSYKVAVLNDIITVEQDIEENLYMEEPEETVTDYTSASDTDKKINQAYILVNKQNQTIQQLTQNVTEYAEKTAEIEQTVDSITSKVESMEEFAREISSYNQLHLSDTAENENLVLTFTAYGDTEKFKVLVPSESLTPSEELVPYGDTFDLVVDTQPRTNPSGNETVFKVKMGEPLRNIDDVKDEFNIINNKASITRRIGAIFPKTTNIFEKGRINNGQIANSDNYMISDYIDVEEQKSYDTKFEYEENKPFELSLVAFFDKEYNYISSEKLSGTSATFTTVADTKYVRIQFYYNSEGVIEEFSLKNFSIMENGRTSGELYVLDEEVTENLGEIKLPTFEENTYIYIREYANVYYFCRYIVDNDYLTQFASQSDLQDAVVELNTWIEQTNSSITLLASEKVGKDEVISSINMTPETIKILAKVLTLEGYTTINGGFKIDEEGNMEANNGTFVGGKLTLTGNTGSNSILYIYNSLYNTFIAPDGIRTNGENDGKAYMYVDDSGGGVTISDTSGNSSFIRGNRINVGGAVSATAFNNSSKIELKENVKLFNEQGLDLIKSADVYTYNYKIDKSRKCIGLVIGKNYRTPEEIISNNESIDIYAMTSVAWKAIQELDEKIEKTIKTLKSIPILGRIFTKRWRKK